MENALNMERTTCAPAADLQAGGSGAKRNMGIDMLRLLAMLYIVTHHVLMHGGFLDNTVGVKNHAAWLLNCVVFRSVNIYAIIGGYVGYTDKDKPFRTAKYLTMWLQVFFYSVGITFLFYLTDPSVTGASLIRAAFPVTTCQYWYFSAFTCVFFLKPWLNRFIRGLSGKETGLFLLAVITLFSVYTMFAHRFGYDPFGLTTGYNTVWLLILYLVGAGLKKSGAAAAIRSRDAVIFIVGCTLLTWVGKQFLPPVIGGGVLYSFLSPTLFLSAIAYVIVFSKLRLPNRLSGIVAFLAPAAFGVYLLHDNDLIREHFLSQLYRWSGGNSAVWYFMLYIIGAAVLIFLSCLLIEKLRLSLFKLLKINAVTDRAGDRIDRVVAGVKNRFLSKLQINDDNIS